MMEFIIDTWPLISVLAISLLVAVMLHPDERKSRS